jgi:diacylglycerol kinase family enzyme
VDRQDVLGALAAFTAGAERRVDLAEVNGRVFVNNVSLGIYGEAVRRAAYRDAKVRTLLTTADEVLAPRGHVPAMRVVDDTGRMHEHLAVLLVSNNPYLLERPPAGTRPRVDSGRLGVIALDTSQAPPHPPGRSWTTPHLDVTATAPVHAGLDGEAVDLSPPLRFTIRPAALRARVAGLSMP